MSTYSSSSGSSSSGSSSSGGSSESSNSEINGSARPTEEASSAVVSVGESERSSFEQFGPNAGFVRELYALFLQDPSAVGDGWAEFFSNLGNGSEAALARAVTSGLEVNRGYSNEATQLDVSGSLIENVCRLVGEYRTRGHLAAKINPLSSTAVDAQTWQKQPIDLSPANFNISGSELGQSISFEGRTVCVGQLANELKEIYTHTVGFEYQHLTDPSARNFLKERIEGWRLAKLSAAEKKTIYKMLVDAETLESELHKKFVGQKRFSLQGGESLMPMLDTVLNAAARAGVSESIFGMAHRGRLDVLTAIAGKPLESLFNEFLDNTAATTNGDGDVKYHLGSTAKYAGVLVTLVPNPSHLEFVNCVVEGVARARQDTAFGADRLKVLPIVIHGDAAFAGQGCVFETLGLSAVSTYATGGTINIVINNQIGFTTKASEARSSVYCTDMAKAVEAPVFHVNGEDPEACCWVAALAFEYRMKFGKDVVIDMYCYRKYGHNEGDDPTFTQPLMYKEIHAKKSVMNQYADKLIEEGVLSTDSAAAEIAEFKKRFADAEQKAVEKMEKVVVSAAVKPEKLTKHTVRAIKDAELVEISKLLVSAPSGFTIHPKLKKILEKRNEGLAGDTIEWGLAEALAFGSLLKDGYSVRLSGQDCGRGTFSHRHLLLSDNDTGQHYSVLSPLANKENGARFDIMNSILSETAVMGFEFGYAATAPKTLVIWEGQFGDFANGGQVIIDQFLAASEMKWRQNSGLTLLLPHGFEGQGPEHSSARLERFLQLCAQNNMMVCNPSNAAQIFHLLRLQGTNPTRRPLVVMSPKSLLRAPQAMCAISALTGKDAGWKPFIVEKAVKTANAVIGCSGKVAFDILTRVKETGSAIDVVQVEQLYPLETEELKKLIGNRKFIWAQEEPENMGAYRYIQNAMIKLGITTHYAGRRAAASPATGSAKHHAIEQKQLVDDAMGLAGK